MTPTELPPILADKVEMWPVEKVKPHPQNPNRGDVEAIVESVRANGFFDPIVVQLTTSYALSGNHRLESARALGMAEVPVVVIDVDDERATRILLAANQTAKRSIYEDEVLVRLLTTLQEGEAGLVGTGFDSTDLATLMTQRMRDDTPDLPPAEGRTQQWEAAAIRQLILPYDTDRFEAIVVRLGRLREAMELEDNAAVVLRLATEAAAPEAA